MTESEHTELAELLLANAAPMSRNTRTAIIAGELVWGAAVQAMHAVGHRLAVRPQHSVKRNGLTTILQAITTDADMQLELNNGLTTTQRRLHNNFYTASLGEARLREEITAGVAFVRLLLDIARRQGGTT